MPPPRSGDWNSVNRFLTAGGTVEGIPRENPYREYYLHLQALHKKNMKERRILAVNNKWHIDIDYDDYDITVTDSAHEDNAICLTRKEWKRVIRTLTEILNDGTNPCGKPHNNGRESCMECDMIKSGE